MPLGDFAWQVETQPPFFFGAHEQIIVRVRVHHYHVWLYRECFSHHYEVEHDETPV